MSHFLLCTLFQGYFLHMNEKNMLESTDLCLQIKTATILKWTYGSTSCQQILKLLGQVHTYTHIEQIFDSRRLF